MWWAFFKEGSPVMPLISDLFQRLPSVKDVHMSASGLALWICWEGDLGQAVPQTLQDYGGLSVVTEHDQSLWFFFSGDVFLALARLAVWAQFNELPVSIQVLPARLLLSVRREMSLALDTVLMHQEMWATHDLQIWIHPKTKEFAGLQPGISYSKVAPLKGMASQDWEHLEADARLPYTSSQGWYSLIRPLGNPLDKNFQTGWRFMTSKFDEILQKLKLKFNINNNYIMLPLENLRVLRSWMRDVLTFLSSAKSESDYWPTVCVVVDRKGLNFNNELPQKVGINWNNLMPDFPYMSYRNAFLLGEGFQITDLHFSSTNSSMDSWCTVALSEGGQITDGSIPILVSGQLIFGEGSGCFYCGARNHESNECPTKHMLLSGMDNWENFSDMSIDTINESFRSIEKQLVDAGGSSGYDKLLDEGSPEGRLMRMIFEINLPLQLRIIERVWLSTGREFPNSGDNWSDGKEITQQDDSPVWGLLERLRKCRPTELISFEKDIHSAMQRTQRDHRMRALLGFTLMERGEYTKAQEYWKQAESLSGSSLCQAWYLLLQGRLLEIQGKYSEAAEVYQNVLRLNPQWDEAEYRQLVCRVKMGFAEQIQPHVLQMVEQHPNMFNRFLIDPELERGHLIILTALYPHWMANKHLADEEKAQIDRLLEEVDNWFAVDHPIAQRLKQRLHDLNKQTRTDNYLAYLNVVRTRPLIEKDFNMQIQVEIEDLKARYKNYLGILETIRDEAAWFPFPKVLVEFNRDFNECAGIINWAFGANFHEAESFKRARGYVPSIVELLTKLEKRLRFLRVVRDSTLFVLILVRTFFWIEVAGIILCVIGVPTLAVFGQDIGLGWISAMIKNNRWELQRVLIIILSIMSLGIAALRTTLVFEKRRDNLLASAKAQREEMQRARLERIREAVRLKEEENAARDPSRWMIEE